MSGEERLKVGTRDNHNLLSDAVKVGNHSGLVDDFAVSKVDIPDRSTVVGQRDAKDDRDRTGGTSATSPVCGR